MVNFATPAPTYSTKRLYKPISDLEDFCAVNDESLDNTSMNQSVSLPNR
ncbi:MAG TPA: hypothetical protein O0X42_01175 [Methanocorpusculum sp.]|nr:hypothetical protein [Methanocorpusculum sp.]